MFRNVCFFIPGYEHLSLPGTGIESCPRRKPLRDSPEFELEQVVLVSFRLGISRSFSQVESIFFLTKETKATKSKSALANQVRGMCHMLTRAAGTGHAPK